MFFQKNKEGAEKAHINNQAEVKKNQLRNQAEVKKINMENQKNMVRRDQVREEEAKKRWMDMYK